MPVRPLWRKHTQTMGEKLIKLSRCISFQCNILPDIFSIFHNDSEYLKNFPPPGFFFAVKLISRKLNWKTFYLCSTFFNSPWQARVLYFFFVAGFLFYFGGKEKCFKWNNWMKANWTATRVKTLNSFSCGFWWGISQTKKWVMWKGKTAWVDEIGFKISLLNKVSIKTKFSL